MGEGHSLRERYLHYLITQTDQGLMGDLTHKHNYKYHEWFLNDPAVIYPSKWMFSFQKYPKGKNLILLLKCSEADSSKKTIFKLVSLKGQIWVCLLESIALFYTSSSRTWKSFVNIARWIFKISTVGIVSAATNQSRPGLNAAPGCAGWLFDQRTHMPWVVWHIKTLDIQTKDRVCLQELLILGSSSYEQLT